MLRMYENMPEERINQNIWCLIDRPQETLAEAVKNECGTVGCAAAHTILRWGLRNWTLKSILGSYYAKQEEADLFDGHDNRLDFAEEAMRILGLNDREARFLFRSNDSFLSDRQAVIDRLEILLKGKE